MVFLDFFDELAVIAKYIRNLFRRETTYCRENALEITISKTKIFFEPDKNSTWMPYCSYCF